jgi:ABC-type transport system involved in multi-copper enzyme maturation permease subunit
MLHLIEKEILDNILSRRFQILAIFSFVLVGFSLFDGIAYYYGKLEEYRIAHSATERHVQRIMEVDELANRGTYKWHEIHSLGYLVHKPPVPLSIFVRGLDHTLGQSANTAMGERRRVFHSLATDNLLFDAIPPLDLSTVFQVLFSLFMLLLSYDAISGEKESGTLRLLMSFGRSRYEIILAKIAGLFVPILVILVLLLLLSVLVVSVLPEVQLTSGEWIRLAIICIAFVIYCLVFLCAGLASSSLVHRSATSFVVLLAFWVVTVLVIPRVSLIFSDQISDIPSVAALEVEKQALFKGGIRERDRQAGQWRDSYRATNNKDAFQTPEGRVAYWEKLAELGRQVYAGVWRQQKQMDDKFQNEFNSRIQLASALAQLSPRFSLNRSSMELAGTGITYHNQFLQSYKDFMVKRFEWGEVAYTRDKRRLENPQVHGKYKWDVSDIPLFDYRVKLGSENISSGFYDLGILMLWCLLLFVIAGVGFLKYDVR